MHKVQAMPKSIITHFSLALIAVAVSACANVTQSSNAPKPVPAAAHGNGLAAVAATQSSIQGSWTSPCLQSANGYSVATLTFQNAVMKTDTVTYVDQKCTFALTEEIRTSNFTIQTISGSTDLKENLVTIDYKPLVASEVNFYNQTSFCQLKNWTLGSAETFTDGSVCTGVGTQVIYHLELYGKSQELYLDSCTGTGATSCAVQFNSTASAPK
jgi:hypothetical protein